MADCDARDPFSLAMIALLVSRLHARALRAGPVPIRSRPRLPPVLPKPLSAEDLVQSSPGMVSLSPVRALRQGAQPALPIPVRMEPLPALAALTRSNATEGAAAVIMPSLPITGRMAAQRSVVVGIPTWERGLDRTSLQSRVSTKPGLKPDVAGVAGNVLLQKTTTMQPWMLASSVRNQGTSLLLSKSTQEAVAPLLGPKPDFYQAVATIASVTRNKPRNQKPGAVVPAKAGRATAVMPTDRFGTRGAALGLDLRSKQRDGNPISLERSVVPPPVALRDIVPDGAGLKRSVPPAAIRNATLNRVVDGTSEPGVGPDSAAATSNMRLAGGVVVDGRRIGRISANSLARDASLPLSTQSRPNIRSTTVYSGMRIPQ